jgi:hypothetical protein
MARRSPYANPDVEDSVLDIDAAFRESFRKISARLTKLIRDIKRGQGVKYGDAATAAKIRRLILQLENEMNEAGFDDILSEQRIALRSMTKAIIDEAKDLDLPDTFSVAEKEQIKLLRSGSHHRLIMHRRKAASELEQILVRSATANVDTDDVVQAIARNLEITETQARTEAERTIATFHTQTRVERSTRAGVKWFLYRGPQDSRNRNFCAHFVGTRVTIEILARHAGRFDRDPKFVPVAAWLGTYNCRHELVPLVTEERIAQYKIGPLPPGASRRVEQPKKKAA